MNAYELAKKLEWYTNYDEFVEAGAMLRQQADRIAELEKELQRINANAEFELDRAYNTPQIKELSDEQNNLKWWISSFEHLKALGGGISNEMETKLKDMKEILKKASEK